MVIMIISYIIRWTQSFKASFDAIDGYYSHFGYCTIIPLFIVSG